MALYQVQGFVAPNDTRGWIERGCGRLIGVILPSATETIPGTVTARPGKSVTFVEIAYVR